MEFRQNRGPKSLLRQSVFLSGFIHLLFLASLWFFLRSDSIEKASGSEGSEGAVYVSLVTPSFVRRGKGAVETPETYPTPTLPLQRGGNNSGGGGEGGSSDILRQIKIKIERAKFYPLIAKRTRLEGAPEVELKIKQNGSLEYVSLKKSCGSPLLDEAALSTVKLAAPYPFYPDPIGVGIDYNLK